VSRTALLTGTPGALLEAIAAALAGAGFVPRHVPMGADGSLRLEVPPGGAPVVVHVGLRSARALPERERADAEAVAAAGAAELARASGARRLVHVSSVSVYGRPRNLPCREGELKAPRTAEERIRWRAEQASWAAFRRGAPLTVLRPAAVYGPTLRGGPVRALALFALFGPRGGRIPIIRRGPVAHLVHLEDVARAALHVATHPDDAAVVGRAFNVADEAPLPLSEHLETALAALGYRPGRILPTFPRLTSSLLWLFRHVPDHALLDRVNRRLEVRWRDLAARTGTAPALAPRIDREALHWIAADHYYDTSRLARIGWRARHPVSTPAVVETIRGLLSQRLLPGAGRDALPAW
jgi:nucleoside-diphosphate-sugar epimerase